MNSIRKNENESKELFIFPQDGSDFLPEGQHLIKYFTLVPFFFFHDSLESETSGLKLVEDSHRF